MKKRKKQKITLIDKLIQCAKIVDLNEPTVAKKVKISDFKNKYEYLSNVREFLFFSKKLNHYVIVETFDFNNYFICDLLNFVWNFKKEQFVEEPHTIHTKSLFEIIDFLDI